MVELGPVTKNPQPEYVWTCARCGQEHSVIASEERVATLPDGWEREADRVLCHGCHDQWRRFWRNARTNPCTKGRRILPGEAEVTTP